MNSIKLPAEHQQDHQQFHESRREHLLMLTTHGVHQWRVMPGLPDTGGQNVFVNQFSQALVDQGYRVTIANRGGYPHPVTHEPQKGLLYKDAYQRLIYLEDGHEAFVRKEDMGEHVVALAQSLEQFLRLEGDDIRAIISHYWDAARVGQIYNQARSHSVLHAWVPHSLGMIKRENVSQQQSIHLRIDERIETERKLLARIPAVAATSSRIKASLLEDYGYDGLVPFLPPCVDTSRYRSRTIEDDDEIWSFLSEIGGVNPARLRSGNVVTEISRTDKTKRKDILLQALAQVIKEKPEVFMILSIDPQAGPLAEDLKRLIGELELERNVIVVGSVWEKLPKIYAITDIYCTPSVMEGFGMSAQEAAATGVPVVASELVPFVEEYLLGQRIQEIPCAGCTRPLRVGEGAISVAADDVNGFAEAILTLLRDKKLRKEMGRRALEITIPYFTWPSQTQAFLEALGLKSGRGG